MGCKYTQFLNSLLHLTMQIQLLPATQKDFSAIASLADQIWHKHYVPIIGEEQVNYMLGKIYSEAGLKEQLEVKKHSFYLIQDDSGKVIGFISISNENATDYWIHKFYILDNQQGKGIGAKVFEEIKSKMPGMKCIRLTVNRQNHKSINFYFKIGFVIEQVADFDIGNGYFMNDFVMIWKRR